MPPPAPPRAHVHVRRASARDAAAVDELLASSPHALTLVLAAGGVAPAPVAACIERGVVALVAEEHGGAGGGHARLVGFAAAADRLAESDAHAIDALLADVQACVVDAVVSVRLLSRGRRRAARRPAMAPALPPLLANGCCPRPAPFRPASPRPPLLARLLLRATHAVRRH